MTEMIQPMQVEKTKKQIDSKKRFEKFYAEKLKGQSVTRECECGCSVLYMGLSRHRTTKKHKRIMDAKEEKTEEVKEDYQATSSEPKCPFPGMINEMENQKSKAENGITWTYGA